MKDSHLNQSRRSFMQTLTQGLGTLLSLPIFAAVSSSCGTEISGGQCSNGVGDTQHGHSFSVSQEDLEAGAEKTYSIQGSAGHDHTFTLSEADFETLNNGGSVSKTSSSTNSHTHSISINC